jgi:hypothetical protein
MRLLTLCILSLIPTLCFAQRFGGTPPPVKWNQVNTDTARIIFPVGLDSQAKRVASIVHQLAAQTPVPLGRKLSKINIVLQNQTTIANGYVGLGPYRSEFFLTPALNNFDQGTLPWDDQLAMHEYRHVQQYNNFHHGLSQLMRVLFGEEGYAVATNAAVPDWFFEGDAVYNETALTRQGRGRLPLFLNAYPSLWRAGKKYSWMKLRNGSFKDYVPNHYNLGYLLINYGREKYGLDFWEKVTKDASAFKGLFYPFQHAIKKYAGVDYKTFYTAAFDYYKNLSVAADTSTKKGQDTLVHNLLPVNEKVVTSYMFPYHISADSLVYFRASLDKRPAFYIKDKNGEHRLRTRDISTDEQFSYRNGKLVYAAIETDPRWAWRDYSVIKLLDVATNKQQTIRHKTKYFTPDISPSGERIAGVEIASSGKCELHILDAKSGNTIMQFKSADINLFTDPKFIDENTLVCAVRLQDGRMALAFADMATGGIERLSSPSFNVVGYPNVTPDYIYFTASYEGNDGIYAMRWKDKKIFRVSKGPLGRYFVNAGNGKITWSEFTAEGYQLQEMAEKDIQWTPITDATITKLSTSFPVSHSSELPDVLGNIAPRNFAVSKYRKSTRLLNFHSWRPYYEDPIFTFSLYGENVLNTLQTEIYYLYNQNEGTNAVGLSTVFGAWFPYLSFGTQMTFARQDSVGNLLRTWNQLDTRVGISVPLNFTSGRTFKSMNIGTNYVLRNEFNTGPNKDLTGTNDFTYLHHFLSFSQTVQRAVQHIFPRLGYSLSLNHRYAVTQIDGYQFIGSGSIYLPGALSNHSLVLTGSFQQRDTLRALFSSAFANARGYEDYYNTTAGSRMWRLSANYHLPLFIPDWGFGNILYLQRVRGNLFYDLQRLYSNNKINTADLHSYGGEIYVDTKWWNQYELTFGFRVSHLLDNDPRAGNAKGANVFEFILPVSIIPR